MYMNPTIGLRPFALRRLAMILIVALIASVGGNYWAAGTAAVIASSVSRSGSHATVCKCAHCPGGAACCCHDSACEGR